MNIWNGKFSHDEADYGILDDVEFELHVNLDQGSFSGTATDPEFSELCKLPIHVNGFVDGDHISFVKVYPFWYGLDENDVLYLDETKKEHRVEYDGYYDPNVNQWTGHWEILIDETKVEFEVYEQVYLGGSWEMELPFDSYNKD